MGEIPNVYLSTYFAKTKFKLVSTLIFPGVGMYGCSPLCIESSFPSTWTANGNFLYQVESQEGLGAFDRSVAFFVCNQEVPVESMHEFVSTFFEHVKPKHLLILDTLDFANCNELQSYPLHILETTIVRNSFPLHENDHAVYLKSPVMTDTLGAAFLIRAEYFNIWARLAISLSTNRVDADSRMEILCRFRYFSSLLPNNKFSMDERNLSENLIIQSYIKSNRLLKMTHI